MTKQEIYESLYKFLMLPNYSSITQVKRNKKYLFSDLNYNTKKISVSKKKSNKLSIVEKDFKPSLFSEIAVLSANSLSNKSSKEKYDNFLKGSIDIDSELVSKINDIIEKYEEDLNLNIVSFIEGEYIEIGAVYYYEIKKQESLKLAYLEDINSSNGFNKVKFLGKYFFEYLIPNYWGYIVLAITLILLAAGIIYGLAS